MKLKRISKNKYLFENGLEIGLSNEIVNEYNLRRREELSHEEYLKVLELAALSASYYYLSKRDYSEKEIYLKLLQKYREKESVSKVINALIKKGYLDDYEFAKTYISSKKGSKKKLEYQMRLKGINSDIINLVLDDYEKDDELEELRKELRKLKNKDENKKIMSLMRKGYNYNDIKTVIQEEEEEEC